MKEIFISTLLFSSLLIAACNNGDENTKGPSKMDSGTTLVSSLDKTDSIKEISPIYANVDATVSGYLKNIVDHYLHIKNALANNNSSEAANGGNMLSQALTQVDKTFFSGDQKKVYGDIEEGLKEDAEHISKNGSNITHQREHFSSLSSDLYVLVKSFGGGRTLYHDNCPMYNNKKGAIWLSEVKEIRNPYMGKEMATCGNAEEKIK